MNDKIMFEFGELKTLQNLEKIQVLSYYEEEDGRCYVYTQVIDKEETKTTGEHKYFEALSTEELKELPLESLSKKIKKNLKIKAAINICYYKYVEEPEKNKNTEV